LAHEGDQLRLASDHDIAAAVTRLAEVESRLSGYRADMLGHPTAGRCLRNYTLLTTYPQLLGGLELSEAERFWSRYYWLARFAREWQAAVGYDAGLEQQVFQLLESAEHIPVAYDALPDVEAAVERDAVVRSPD
jgi:hypothetical protein